MIEFAKIALLASVRGSFSNVAAIERNLLPIIAFRSDFWKLGSFCRTLRRENEVKDEMMKFNLLIRRYIELSKWIKPGMEHHSQENIFSIDCNVITRNALNLIIIMTRDYQSFCGSI